MESCSLRRASRALSLVLVALGAACAEGTAIEETSSASGSTASGDGGFGGAGGEGSGKTTSPSSSTSGTPSSTSASSSSTGTGAGGDLGAGGSGGSGGTADGGGGATSTTASSSASSSASSTVATSTASTGDNPLDQLCDPGEFVTAVDTEGVITCAPFAALATSAITSGCYLYLGWRDSCDGCTTAPAKWGWAGSNACSNGLGTNGTCVATSLGGTSVNLYGLNTDNDVDGNDKFYGSLHCTQGDATPQPGPCGAGEFVSAVADSGVVCTPSSGLALGRVRSTCHLYMGWRDSCNGCTDPPSKWGRVNDTSCSNGLGTNNTCTVASLGGESVRLFGLNLDGEADGNDKFHIGLRCDDAVDDTTTVDDTCPAGMLVTGIHADGTLRCKSPSEESTAAFRDGCTAYYGWRDSCDGCTTTPAKWGYVTAGGCQNGLGGDNSCAVTSLGGNSVSLFGLNTDGEVNDDDKFYIGLECN